MTFLRNFWKEERGQDVTEYALLMMFVALASAGLFLSANGSIAGILTNSNAKVSAANSGLSGS